MRVFARKEQQAIPLIKRQVNRPVSHAELNARALRDSFHGWLRLVSPQSAGRSYSSAPAATRLPRLTVLAVTRVNQATVREGDSHRVWPPYILQKFQTAEVITDNGMKHYELRDASLRAISHK
jgi:hypothetical protein